MQQAAAKAGRPWEVGKSFDKSAPCGDIYPASAVGHITSGKIELAVSGNVKQSSDINLMIWDVAHIIHHLSLQVAICPGDLIFTGTPDGVGAARGRFLKAGELIRSGAEVIGELSNRCVEAAR